MGTQKDKWLILTAGDLEVTLKDEHNADRQEEGLDPIYLLLQEHLKDQRKENKLSPKLAEGIKY